MVFCLTVDIDWAHDAVIKDALELIEQYGAKATWFVTHPTAILDEVRAAGMHELGLHPNFNQLLEGQTAHARDIVYELQQFVPEASSVRSHSLLRSNRLAFTFREMGLTHESNYFLPPSVGTDVAAWRDFSGLVQVPIRWEDDVRLIDPSIAEPVEFLDRLSLCTFDFHPIHIFLNTCTLEDYESARPDFQHPHRLLMRRRPMGSGGSRDRLIRLLEAVRAQNVPTCRLGSIHPDTAA